MGETAKCSAARRDKLVNTTGEELVFEFEDDCMQVEANSEDTAEIAAVKSQLQLLVEPPPEAVKLLAAVAKLTGIRLGSGNSWTYEELGAALSQLGCSVSIRRALGARSVDKCLEALRHEVIVCSCGSSQQSFSFSPAFKRASELIIDLNFRDSFKLARPTLAYNQLLEALPTVFIGHPYELRCIVTVMCTQAAQAFERNGMSVPPWRRLKAVLTKWFPSESSLSKTCPLCGGIVVSSDSEGPRPFKLQFCEGHVHSRVTTFLTQSTVTAA